MHVTVREVVLRFLESQIGVETIDMKMNMVEMIVRSIEYSDGETKQETLS